MNNKVGQNNSVMMMRGMDWILHLAGLCLIPGLRRRAEVSATTSDSNFNRWNKPLVILLEHVPEGAEPGRVSQL